MRILPRIKKPKLKRHLRKWRRWWKDLSVESIALGVEALIFVLGLTIIFTGKRAAVLDSWGRRADLVAIFLLTGVMVALHQLAKHYLLPRIARYISPAAYQERQVLFSLGQEARSATNIQELYEAIARRIASAFEADNVSILVRSDVTGDFEAQVSSSTSTSDDSGQAKLSRDAFVVKRLQGLSTPLVIESTDFEIWNRALDTGTSLTRSARVSERDVLRQLKSHLLVQVRSKDQLVGILSLGLRRGHFRYSTSDREVLTSVAGQLALVVENSRLAERMVVQEKLTRELAMAVEVQRRLLPARSPDSTALELAGFCEPARGVGGDYYDFIVRDDSQLGIAIADVSGKGLPAALLMSTVQATLRSLAAKHGNTANGHISLAETVGTLNRLLCDSTGGANYVTFFYAQFDPSTKQLVYVNAGHNPPLYMSADSLNDFTPLNCGGLIVGAFRDCVYEQALIETKPGDLMFAYTDGLTEALDRHGEEFGEHRIKETLKSHSRLSVYEIRDELVRRVKEWSRGAPQYDDLTFVIMKVPLDESVTLNLDSAPVVEEMELVC
ncbi:MAG TPA: GAF domain-containing SpoIIE family protein phosphatase [Pyrinomonadaceae bacterium]|nr:GAF domain-containing SpoIIE family protein phosphatase [Pyrinomonadaceae bacterium]